MKQFLCIISLFVVACHSRQERFIREASAFPEGYPGRWEVVLPGEGSRIFQAGIYIEASGDSLLWNYFSQLVDTTSNRKFACGPEVFQMPIWWDDSTQVAQGNHGANQGYGFDALRLLDGTTLQLNSPWLATNCRGPGGFNSSQLVFSKVNSFRYKP